MPALADCGLSVTCHTPGAAARVGDADELPLALRAGVDVQVGNESDAGAVKSRGSVARGELGEPAALLRAPAPPSCGPCSPQAGAGGRHQRRLDLPAASSRDAAGAGARPRPRCAASPCSCRRRRRTASLRTRAGSRRGSARRAPRRPASAGGRTSVGPADEKLVITPPRPVAICCGVAADADRRLRRRAWPRYARSCAPSRSAIIPAGIGELRRDRIRLAGAVVDEDDPDRAGGLRVRGLRRRRRRRRARRARSCRCSEPAGSVVPAPFGFAGGAAEVALDGLAVGAAIGRRRRASGRPSPSSAGASLDSERDRLEARRRVRVLDARASARRRRSSRRPRR